MTEKIITKTFIHGNEKESSWPSDFGKGKRGVFHINDKGECVEGVAPSKLQIFGKACNFISDTTTPYYHPGAQLWTDSKSAIKQMDAATNTFTTDKLVMPDGSKQREFEKAQRKDIRESIQKAVGAIDAGNSPLTEHQRAECALRNETISNATGIDAFNAMGRISNARGKRYKRKHNISNG